MRRLFFAAWLLLFASAAFAARKPPYWASLNAGQVLMRAGPGRNFPASWLYKRRGLPVKVIAVYKASHSEWRKIEDPGHAVGWVQANLLSDQRTAMVVGEIRSLREKPASDAIIVWRAEPGVVGRLSNCTGDWCSLDVRGRTGFVEVSQIFGVDSGERLP